ncbi:WXG100 family type VII secretion target [Neobacillus citreus]|uniref:WXG100 family type VII secretion target n=1 Tax=Neobacillus citreus TaxID=2833578 RepID=A0A942T2L5_9BACI|nr:WXG100 family type VII secretion target [Neobacillus citreus]MCH6268197.1 WXG100 family type VII secretion target [Neobacillus citreus]
MSQIKIDTAKVVNTASRITTINQQIDAEFARMEKAIAHLNGSWQSRASDHVIGRFHSIKHAFKDSRFQVMQNYSKFLVQQVSDGYNKTETVNTNLADSFK